jgi:hypothetical protein
MRTYPVKALLKSKNALPTQALMGDPGHHVNGLIDPAGSANVRHPENPPPN